MHRPPTLPSWSSGVRGWLRLESKFLPDWLLQSGDYRITGEMAMLRQQRARQEQRGR